MIVDFILRAEDPFASWALMNDMVPVQVASIKRKLLVRM